MSKTHTFSRGDAVAIFQWSPRGYFIEGRATIDTPIDGAPDVYWVRFKKPVGLSDRYERYVDPDGQADPEAWLQVLNSTRIGAPLPLAS